MFLFTAMAIARLHDIFMTRVPHVRECRRLLCPAFAAFVLVTSLLRFECKEIIFLQFNLQNGPPSHSQRHCCIVRCVQEFARGGNEHQLSFVIHSGGGLFPRTSNHRCAMLML